MPDIEQRFIDEAAAELRAEDEAKFMSRVRLRAAVLQEQARRLEVSDLRDPLVRLAELQTRHDFLATKKLRVRPGCLSAVEDSELDGLPYRISELTKACRMGGLLLPTAA
jgi:hypothetical protein